MPPPPRAAPAAHPINRRMNCNDSPRPRATLADVQLLRSAGKRGHVTEMTHEGSSVKRRPANNVSLQRVFKVEECAAVLYTFSQYGYVRIGIFEPLRKTGMAKVAVTVTYKQ